MGVSTKYIEHNENNRILLEGSRKLGYSAKEVPQNTGGNKHYCGYCTLGCGAAEKQGPVVSWLPDAANAGAKFMEGFEADKVVFEVIDGKKTVAGVEGTWTSRDEMGGVSSSKRTIRKVMIKAKRIVVSCGTLHSPLLLLRSGLMNPNIGRNLYCHPGKHKSLTELSGLNHSPASLPYWDPLPFFPLSITSSLIHCSTVTLVTASFPHTINPWEGPILTTLCTQFASLSPSGHGAKIEAMTMLPSWALPFQPWRSALDFKLLAAKFPNMCSHIALVRDRDPGRVYPDPVDGRCKIAYTPSKFDREHAMEAVVGICKIMYVMGAEEIWLAKGDVKAFVRSDSADDQEEEGEGKGEEGINNPSFQTWLRDEVRKKGMGQPETGWGSAHQMGTCRMAASEKKGVVDSKGKVWGVEGLYVADASVFPSASGVNPMVTNMAISDMISRGVAREMKGEKV